MNILPLVCHCVCAPVWCGGHWHRSDLCEDANTPALETCVPVGQFVHDAHFKKENCARCLTLQVSWMDVFFEFHIDSVLVFLLVTIWSI